MQHGIHWLVTDCKITPHTLSLSPDGGATMRSSPPGYQVKCMECMVLCPHSAFFKYAIVVGVMKMGNIVPRAGLEPTSLAFRASVQLLHIGSLISPLSPRLPVYAAPSLRGQCTHHYTVS